MADQTKTPLPRKRGGILLLDCQHCDGTGECNKGKTADKIHSCPYCVNKAELRGETSLFPKVPCAYCQGLGKRVVDLKVQKENIQKPTPKKR